MRKSIIYRGTYRDIQWEINNFSFEENGDLEKWTFYLFLYAESFSEPDSVIPQTVYTSYGSKLEIPKEGCALHNLEWHGGLTYLSVESQEPFTFLKAGCDYQHLWDEGRYYNEKYIQADIKECIDSLYKRFPEFKNSSILLQDFRDKFREIIGDPS